MTREDLYQAVTRFKLLCVMRARGSDPDEGEFINLRHELLTHPLTASKLPAFVKTCMRVREFWLFIKPLFPSYAQREQYLQEQFAPLLQMLEASNNSPHHETTNAALQSWDVGHVQDAWTKALERKPSDPGAAVTMARTLLESVIKQILCDRGVTYKDGDDLSTLYKGASSALGLSPGEQVDEELRRVFSGCVSIVTGIGNLRNKLGDAHGKASGDRSAESRHARLAVDMAGSMAVFLIEHHQATEDMA